MTVQPKRKQYFQGLTWHIMDYWLEVPVKEFEKKFG